MCTSHTDAFRMMKRKKTKMLDGISFSCQSNRINRVAVMHFVTRLTLMENHAHNLYEALYPPTEICHKRVRNTIQQKKKNLSTKLQFPRNSDTKVHG